MFFGAKNRDQISNLAKNDGIDSPYYIQPGEVLSGRATLQYDFIG